MAWPNFPSSISKKHLKILDVSLHEPELRHVQVFGRRLRKPKWQSSRRRFGEKDKLTKGIEGVRKILPRSWHNVYQLADFLWWFLSWHRSLFWTELRLTDAANFPSLTFVASLGAVNRLHINEHRIVFGKLRR
jgi:hypothetical protein